MNCIQPFCKLQASDLGALGMARFLQQFDRGSGDYTRDRDTILAGITLEEAIAQIKQAREGNG